MIDRSVDDSRSPSSVGDSLNEGLRQDWVVNLIIVLESEFDYFEV